MSDRLTFILTNMLCVSIGELNQNKQDFNQNLENLEGY